MSSNPNVFLDTSIQIERFMGPNRKRAAIEEVLADSQTQFITSNYVFMEFQRSVLSNHVTVYNEILAHDDWEMVAYAIRSGQQGFRPRALGQCFQILTKALDICERDRQRSRAFLQFHITIDLPRRFWRNVMKLPDPVVCDLVQHGVRHQTNGSYQIADTCRKATAACHLPDFMTQNRTKLQTISDYLSTHPNVIKNQERVQQLIRTTITTPRSVLGQSVCWPLGDIIIALHVPDGAALWTLDADYEPLADALGFSLYSASISTRS
ncbi:MAG: hypothetical protein AAF639_17195 [Chloroflexota bacterium]